MLARGLDGLLQRPAEGRLHPFCQRDQEVDEVAVDVAGIGDRSHLVGVTENRVDHQLLAVGPMAVDARAVHTRQFGDALVAEAGDAVAGYQLGGRSEDLSPHPRIAAAGTPGPLTLIGGFHSCRLSQTSGTVPL